MKCCKHLTTVKKTIDGSSPISRVAVSVKVSIILLLFPSVSFSITMLLQFIIKSMRVHPPLPKRIIQIGSVRSLPPALLKVMNTLRRGNLPMMRSSQPHIYGRESNATNLTRRRRKLLLKLLKNFWRG